VVFSYQLVSATSVTATAVTTATTTTISATIAASAATIASTAAAVSTAASTVASSTTSVFVLFSAHVNLFVDLFDCFLCLRNLTILTDVESEVTSEQSSVSVL
jgi:hypothetical protein